MKIDEEVISRVLGIISNGLDIRSSRIEELWEETDVGKALYFFVRIQMKSVFPWQWMKWPQ